MTGLEALNKFVNIFAEYCVKTQHQEMNATNMQTAVEYLARSEECRTIGKSLKALEIIKEKCLTNCNIALVKDNLHYQNYCKEFEYFLNKYNESPNGFEITKEDLLTEEEFSLLKEVLE